MHLIRSCGDRIGSSGLTRGIQAAGTRLNISFVVALVMVARRVSSEGVSARVMPHMLLLLAMWVGYVMIFTGTTGIPSSLTMIPKPS